MTESPKQWLIPAETVPRKPGSKLASGGHFPSGGHSGHWEVTEKIARELKFSPEAIDILCDAAQDPDFYEFSVPAAHAQTPDCIYDVSGDRAAAIESAIAAYGEWVAANFRKCVLALAAKNTRLALYWLGYMLHGIEDLAVHMGITNGEHAARKISPDHVRANIKFAFEYARQAMGAVRSALGESEFSLLQEHRGDKGYDKPEKLAAIHPKGWDIEDTFGEYRIAGEKYQKMSPKPEPVLWDRERVLACVLQRLQNGN